MQKLKIYLDNCCYNRPYDDQTSPKVVVETLSKLYIQELVLNRKLDLVWSYVLKYENSGNCVESKRDAIGQWEKVSVQFVGKSPSVVAMANEVAATGIHPADSLHIACAIDAKCDYIITVDAKQVSCACYITRMIGLLFVIRWILSVGRLKMTNNAILLDKGIKCLNEGLGMLDAEQFIYILLSQPFDYTEWRKKNLFIDLSVEEISDAADKYCRENS